MSDLTGSYDYDRLIKEEKEEYNGVEITDDLKLGGVHAHEAWHYYWGPVINKIGKSPYGGTNMANFLHEKVIKPGEIIRILSLGSGFCGHEIDYARAMLGPYEITCTDINDEIFAQARGTATKEELSLRFEVADLNFIEIEPQRYHMIFAHAALHHIINLERLFQRVSRGLAPGGIFHIVEVVGMNRKLIWDENERFANALLQALPEKLTRGIRLAVPFHQGGMEGVRQQDILPLIRENFEPCFELLHGAFMRFICTHTELGQLLAPSSSPAAKAAMDFLMDCDESAVRHGILRPLELWGVYKNMEEAA